MNKITPKDVFDSAAKYGEENVLTLATKKKDAKAKKTSNYDVEYVKIKFKHVTGKEISTTLKAFNILAGSSAKIPGNKGEVENNVKYMNIAFKRFSKEEVLTGDYAPKPKSDPIENQKEIERANAVAEKMVESTNRFIDAVHILIKSYVKLCNMLKEAKDLDFTINKNRKIYKTNADIPIISPIQTHRRDPDNPNNDDIKLEEDLIRFKLSVDKDGNIIRTVFENGSSIPVMKRNVYDVKRMVNPDKPVLATVDDEPLNKNNAGKFITYKSRLALDLEINEIIISKSGFSLNGRFGDLFVRSHSNTQIEDTLSPEELAELKGDEETDSEEKEIIRNIRNVNLSDEFSDLDDKESELGDNIVDDVVADDVNDVTDDVDDIKNTKDLDKDVEEYDNDYEDDDDVVLEKETVKVEEPKKTKKTKKTKA